MTRTFRSSRAAAAAALCVLIPLAAPAQTASPSAAPASTVAPLTAAEIAARRPITGSLPTAFAWAPDGRHLLYARPAEGSGPPTMVLRDVAGGSERPFFKARAEGKGARPVLEFAWSPDGARVAFLDAGDLYVGTVATGARRLVAKGADDPQWAPRGNRLAYAHADDLYVADLTTGGTTRVSADGAPGKTNGEPDWVYSEELAMAHAYAWSPDGTRIAYLRFDETGVTKFPIVDFLETDNTTSEQFYPHPGEKNPAVTLRVATLGGATRTLYTTATHDDYLAAIGWSPASVPVAEILDRPQRHARLVAFGETPRTLWSISDPVFLDLNSFSIRGRAALGPVRWLHDGRFLAVAPSGGEDALLVVDPVRGTSRALTRGFHVASISAVDETRGVAYVAGAFDRRSPTAIAVPLGGGTPHALDATRGAHTFTFSDDGRRYVETSSTFDDPPAVAIGTTGGARQILARSRSLAGRGLGTSRLFTIPSRWGPLDAYLILPPGFDETKRYPVVTYVYGGPAAPTTTDRWGGTFELLQQGLAQRGIVAFSIDGPPSRTDRHADRALAGRAGPAMLEGQLAGAAWLKDQPWVDPARLGLWGWSYGGYATAYAMTHAPGVWKAAIAGAPVTDWRLYDSIYTERYLGDPKREKKAYDESSVLAAAGRLQGSLLVVQGTSDDNVHWANSIALQQALLNAGKRADFQFYPRQAHGFRAPAAQRHLIGEMLNWWTTRL